MGPGNTEVGTFAVVHTTVLLVLSTVAPSGIPTLPSVCQGRETRCAASKAFSPFWTSVGRFLVTAAAGIVTILCLTPPAALEAAVSSFASVMTGIALSATADAWPSSFITRANKLTVWVAPGPAEFEPAIVTFPTR